MDRFIDWTKPDFIGHAAAEAERAHGPKRRFCIFEVDADDADVLGSESILQDGTPVGYVTSGAFGHFVGKSLAAGYIPAALARDGAEFRIGVLGRDCRAVVRAAPLHDPAGARLRG